MRKKTHTIIGIITITLFCYVSCNFAPGSYPYAELYKFQISEDLLIKAVENFKAENPKYCLHEQERFTDGRIHKEDQWYHVWFYYPKENQIVKCWIRTSYKGCAELGFIGIGEALSLNNYKKINKDFSRKENKEQKEKFEKLILSEIKKQIE